MGELGPTRPDRLTVWPVENDGFGIDVRWSGADGNRRATVVRGRGGVTYWSYGTESHTTLDGGAGP